MALDRFVGTGNRLAYHIAQQSGQEIAQPHEQTSRKIIPHPMALPTSDVQKKAHALYGYILDNILFKPERDLHFGNRKTIKQTENGLEDLILSDQAYDGFSFFSFLATLVDDGSILYIGEPGTGKTKTPLTLAEVVYGISEIEAKRAVIRGNPELTQQDTLVYTDIGQLIKNGKEVVHPRPFVKSPLRIIDEINRIPPGKVANFYEMADTGEVTYKGWVYKVPSGPLFMTANYKDEGNSGLQAAFLDRADIVMRTEPLDPNFYKLIEQKLQNPKGRPSPFTVNDRSYIRQQISKIKWKDDSLYLLAFFQNELNACAMGSKNSDHKTKSSTEGVKPGNVCDECHYNAETNICKYTENGISTRMYEAVQRFSQATAWFLGRDAIDSEIVANVVPYVYGKKLRPTKNVTDPVYKNDFLSFTEALWQKSVASFETASMKVPVIKQLSLHVADIYQGIPSLTHEQVEESMNDLAKLDTPSKARYGTILKDLWYRTR